MLLTCKVMNLSLGLSRGTRAGDTRELQSTFMKGGAKTMADLAPTPTARMRMTTKSHVRVRPNYYYYY